MRFSIDVPQASAQSVHARGAAATATRKRSTSRKGRLAVTGLAVWAVAGTLQPAPPSAVAAPPAHRHASAAAFPSPQHHGSQHHGSQHHGAFNYGSGSYGSSLSAVKHSGGCSVCGKNRKSLVRKFLDGVTAGTDRLIFGSSYQESCDCDFGGDTACDAGCDTACDAIGSIPFAAGPGSFYSPRHAGSGLELLPTPLHHPPVPPHSHSHPKRPAGGQPVPAPLSPQHPTSDRVPDPQLDPFGDDPVYQGSNPAISRSAYYE